MCCFLPRLGNYGWRESRQCWPLQFSARCLPTCQTLLPAAWPACLHYCPGQAATPPQPNTSSIPAASANTPLALRNSHDKAHRWPWKEERRRSALWITSCQSGSSASTPPPVLPGNTTKRLSRLALLHFMPPLESTKIAVPETPTRVFNSNIPFL